MKIQMKTTRVLDHILKPRVVFICLLIGHPDLWIKTKQIEHKNNTPFYLIIIINQLRSQLSFSLKKIFTSQIVKEEAFKNEKNLLSVFLRFCYTLIFLPYFLSSFLPLIKLIHEKLFSHLFSHKQIMH